MRVPVGLVRPRALSRVAVIALLAGSVAGCSSDTGRFAENPFSNPFGNPFADRADPVSTASVPTQKVQTAALAPVGSVAAQPLAPVGSVGSAPIETVPARTATAVPAIPSSDEAFDAAATASIPEAATGIFKTSRGYWSGKGGSIIQAGANDNIHMIANRFGVPAAAIMAVNGLSTPALTPGQSLTIPVFNVGAAPADTATRQTETAEATQTKSVRVIDIKSPAKTAKGGVHEVQPGETLTSIAASYGTTRVRLAEANGLDQWANVRIGQKLTLPGSKTAKADPKKATPAAKETETAAVETKPAKKAAEVAAVESTPAKASPKADKTVEAKKEPVVTASVEQTPQAEKRTFRWPVKGHIIKSFGQSSGGLNISVPEGTQVKAAEDGVVAYAGNDLKVYGNLILIRHSDGYVTAYAHTKDLDVKKGDTVRRGQVIATAGKTGDVTTPQLLFEIRKGSTAIDPRPYLSGT